MAEKIGPAAPRSVSEQEREALEARAHEIRRLLRLPDDFEGSVTLNFPGHGRMDVKPKVEWYPRVDQARSGVVD